MGVFNGSSGAVRDIERSALLPQRAEQLFALVNDIEKYPEFLPGCAAAEVQRREGDLVEASLELSGAGLRCHLRTRNRLFPPHRITMDMLDGPLKKLSGEWSFTAPSAGGAGCEVRLRLRFQLRSVLLRGLAARFAESAADRLVQAMRARAAALYGCGHSPEAALPAPGQHGSG